MKCTDFFEFPLPGTELLWTVKRLIEILIRKRWRWKAYKLAWRFFKIL